MAILINDILTKAYLLILRMNLNIIKYELIINNI